MKALLFFAFLAFAPAGTDAPAQQQAVYICTGKSSKRYHSKQNCRGLNNCDGSIKKTTVAEAQKIGRTPCKICKP